MSQQVTLLAAGDSSQSYMPSPSEDQPHARANTHTHAHVHIGVHTRTSDRTHADRRGTTGKRARTVVLRNDREKYLRQVRNVIRPE
jgi:hypothetical protein